MAHDKFAKLYEEPEIDKDFVREIENAISKTDLRTMAAIAISSFSRRDENDQVQAVNGHVSRFYVHYDVTSREDEDLAVGKLRDYLRRWLSLYKARFDTTADYE